MFSRMILRALRPKQGIRSLAPLALWLAIIALATLGQGEVRENASYPLDPYCLICGERGAADATLNILLFVPLGIAAARAWDRLPSLIIGVGLSACIEIAQASIPGRFPTIGDIVWNGAGAGLGAALDHARATVTSMAARTRMALACAIIALPLLPAVLMAPAPTGYEYFAQWAPTVSSGRSYAGRVTAATIADIELPRGQLSHSADVRAALRRGAALHISFLLARPSEELSQVFRFVDSRTDEIASLGVRGTDLVWSERRLATALAFGTPSVAWTGTLDGKVPGTAVSVATRKENGSVCMQLDERERCGLVLTASDGWQLLASEPGTRILRVLAGLLWLGLPGLLAGLIAGPALLPLAVVGSVALAAAGATAALPAVGFSAASLATSGAGVLAGSAWARLIRPRGPKQSPSAR